MPGQSIQTQPVFLTRKDLKDLGIKVSASTLIRWEIAGRFPKRARLGGTTVAWPRDLILQWCEDRISERDKFVYAEF
ncbi:MAG: AlpA family phage regulatory protein [Pseudomonadota bacterium]